MSPDDQHVVPRQSSLAKLDRRAFNVALLGAVTPFFVPARARAQQANWAQEFDTTVKSQAAVNSDLPTLSPATADYLERMIPFYQRIASAGGFTRVPEIRALKLGQKSDAVNALRQRLMQSGDLPRSAGLSPVYDSYVNMAVIRYQQRNGLIADGVIGPSTIRTMNIPAYSRLSQMQTNVVRLRSLSGDLGNRYVMVNVPAALIEAVQGGYVRSRHNAVVGKLDRQTPLLSSKLFEANFNPFWTVPVSIIKKDLVPQMQQNPNYLQDNLIRISDWSGNPVPMSDINWDDIEAVARLRFRQDPGEHNSLGQVRINFHNKYQVYMHDTPGKSLFGTDYRFHSSGCVRIQNVRDFVTWLLSDDPEWNRARVDQVFNSGERLDAKFIEEVPVYFTYVTAWATRDGVVHFREDMYQRDGLNGGEVITALQ